MDEPRQDPLSKLRAAVRAAEGPSKVAKRSGVPRTHLQNILSGARPMGRETGSKLRPVLPDVPAEVWVELLAPIATTDDAPEAIA